MDEVDPIPGDSHKVAAQSLDMVFKGKYQVIFNFVEVLRRFRQPGSVSGSKLVQFAAVRLYDQGNAELLDGHRPRRCQDDMKHLYCVWCVGTSFEQATIDSVDIVAVQNLV